MTRQIYNDTWASGGDKVDPGAVKTTLGWVVEAPPHEHFNFYQGRTDEMLQDLERNGIIVYDAATIYDQGGYTREGTIVYRSLVGTNTGNTPSSSPSEWVQAFLIPANNLSDLENAGTARTNLDVYSKAEADANFLDEASNLSDLPNTGTARTNLDVFSKTESNANFLAIGAKAADSELLDGINSTTFARKDQANTFTQDQIIKVSGAATDLILDADTGFDTTITFKENNVRRVLQIYDESLDRLRLIKYDTNGTTVKGILDFENDGSINALSGGVLKQGGNPVYHAGNDGAGSGVDADLLDGVQGSGYLLVGAKAADSELLDGINSTNFARTDIEEVFSNSVGIGNATPGGSFDNGKALAIGDSDTGIRQNGDGLLEIFANNVEVVEIQSNIVRLRKNTEVTGTLTVSSTIQQAGLNVIDTGDAASESVKGIVERASTAEASAGTDTTRYMTPKNVADKVATSGGATISLDNLDATGKKRSITNYVNFNGEGVVAIRASFGVTSVTDLGTGKYRVNFSITHGNINFGAVCSAGDGVGNARMCSPNVHLTTSVELQVKTGGGTNSDPSICSVFVTGD